METLKGDPPKLPDMVMCGDHPSFTKTELNAKEDKLQDKDKKDHLPMSNTRLSPTSSRTDRTALEERTRAISDHALRLIEARRRARSLEVVSRPDDVAKSGNKAIVQAALGSFRWPPYLVAIWVLVLLLTHLLHCVVTLLERALPIIKKFCQYFRSWTEESWKNDTDLNQRIYPIALACVAGSLYVIYFGLYALYAVALWSIEPLYSEEDKREDVETKVTDYVDEIGSKTNSNIK